MMIFCLDTNIVINIMSNRKPHLRTRLKQEIEVGSGIYLPVIVLFELRFGIAKSNRVKESEAAINEFLSQPINMLNFDSMDTHHAADIRAYLELRGTPIGSYDILIAAQARRLGAVLVTENRREFERVPSLMATDWAN
jgi:tRNA(fMet)-specific endonuclease VapC